MTPKPKTTAPEEIVATWALPYAATLGSSVRVRGIFLEVRSRLPAASRNRLSIKARELLLHRPEGSGEDLSKLMAKVSAALEGIESLPVIPREIEDILAIKTTERHRWLKDGRLPSAGTRTVRLRGRASKITFHVFDPRIVEDLLDRDVVEAWREADAITAAENRRRAAWKAKLTRARKQTPAAESTGDVTSPDQLVGWAEFERGEL
jgi:hypothetical protein